MNKASLIIIGLLVLVNIQLVDACSCAQLSLDEYINEADLIFVGKATRISKPFITIDPTEAVKVSLDVTRAYKGDVGKEITIETPQDSASCGYSFEEGGEYLVYGTKENGITSTNLCSGTKNLRDADVDLSKLNVNFNDNQTSPQNIDLSGVIVLGILILVVALLVIAEMYIVSWFKNKKKRRK